MAASKHKRLDLFAGTIVVFISIALAHATIEQMDVAHDFTLPLYLLITAAVFGPIGTLLLFATACYLSVKKQVPFFRFLEGKF
ncbi:hypothetical protein [Aliiglaciecola sp. NS0011-25]|uniref:hypothetical protein n=1 Tax=Aliiglaciecola sp. NS0011-25 TaxID=3127654 RepID=UPI00310968B1